MTSRITRVIGLALILGGFGAFGSPSRAFAQQPPRSNVQREQFLRLLLQRQDEAALNRLTLQKQLLDQRLQRLEQAGPNGFPTLENRLRSQSAQLQQRIANPPSPPLEIRLNQQENSIAQQQRLIDAQIQRLQRTAANNPRRAAQIQEALTRLETRSSQLSNQFQFIDRVVATPFTPSVATSFRIQPRR